MKEGLRESDNKSCSEIVATPVFHWLELMGKAERTKKTNEMCNDEL